MISGIILVVGGKATRASATWLYSPINITQTERNMFSIYNRFAF